MPPREITPQERERFLDALRDGKMRPDAAQHAHASLTGTAFRRLISRDQEFAQEVENAEAEGLLERIDLVRSALMRRALDPEEKSLRALEIEAATLLPDHRWLRKNGQNTGGEPDAERLVRQTVKRELLTDGQIEQLVTLLEYGQGLRQNPELEQELAEKRRARELGPGEVIDGDATQVT